MNKLPQDSAESSRTNLLSALMISVSMAVVGCATPPREPAQELRTTGKIITTTEYCYNPDTGFNEKRVYKN